MQVYGVQLQIGALPGKCLYRKKVDRNIGNGHKQLPSGFGRYIGLNSIGLVGPQFRRL